MRCFVLMLAMLASLGGFSQTPALVRLKSNQPLTVTGTLMMRPSGRLQFVTVKTTAAYVPLFAGGSNVGKPVLEIALAKYDYSLLYAHRGQIVTVSGTLMMDDASPYYRDGMRLEITKITARGGASLAIHQANAEPVAVDVGLYQATAVLPADLAEPWQYKVNGKADARRMLSCSSNGGGDVANCFCADGFRPVAVASSLKDAPGQIYNDMHMAQFSVGDEARAVTLHVTCRR